MPPTKPTKTRQTAKPGKPAAKASKPAAKASKPAAKASKPGAKPSKPAAKASKPAAKPSKPAAKAAANTPAKQATAAKARSASRDDYAFTQGIGMIGEGFPGVTVEKSAHVATAAVGTQVFARMKRDGDDHVVIAIEPTPEARTGLGSRGFVGVPGADGWFQVRLGPDPSAWFRADLTSLVISRVQALRAAADAGRWKSLLSGGGPYVVLPKSAVARWGEDAMGTDAEAATRAPDTAAVIDVAAGPALILGTPDRLHVHRTDDGAVFVRVVSFDADDDEVLTQHVKSVPAAAWSPLDATLEVSEELWAFDASSDGVAIGTGNSLQCDLPRGTYTLHAATYAPDAGTELLLVRLRRA